jgi:prepilin-type N-terminal cleavage/methylation domain-containing protein
VIRRSGFTLVEILIVLAILGITAAAVVPAFTRVAAEDDVTRASREIEAVLLRARATALDRATRVEVGFVPELGRYWIRDGGGEPIDSGTIVMPGGSRMSSNVARPRFYLSPAGVIDGDSIAVLGSGGARAISIDRWTGSIHVATR